MLSATVPWHGKRSRLTEERRPGEVQVVVRIDGEEVARFEDATSEEPFRECTVPGTDPCERPRKMQKDRHENAEAISARSRARPGRPSPPHRTGALSPK
jgi:hypothetical protein